MRTYPGSELDEPAAPRPNPVPPGLKIDMSQRKNGRKLELLHNW